MSSSSSLPLPPPPQTPMGPPRAAQTPMKTPLRTPMRTPGGGEQTSHTPIINFAAIEAHKENVQPLVGGRSAHALITALSQRQAELRQQREAFERLVTGQQNVESDDPLEPWTRYVQWCIDSYPSGQSSESGLILVLERCTRAFRCSPQYKNDIRYLRIWVHYAHNVDCPSDVYNFLLANEIGTGMAKLYEELAAVYEHAQYLDKADETFRLGIHRSAHPVERLKKRYDVFRERILTSEGMKPDAQSDRRKAYKEALASAMVKAQRSMLGTKVGSTSMSANGVRGLGGQAGLSQSSASLLSGNAARPAVRPDADGDDVFARTADPAKPKWMDVGTNASRKQEKGPESRKWKGEVLPQRDAVATPKRPAIAIYRDSDEECGEEDEGRTPGKAGRTADVFTKARELSETDKLRRNPFSNYHEAELKPTVEEKAKGPTKASKTKKPSSSAVAAKEAKAGTVVKEERYAIAMKLLYPGLDIEQAVRKVSKKQRSGEVCMEELISIRHYGADTDDRWAYLNERHGQWLPEIRAPIKARPIKKDPTVTAFTKAAQDEVLQMFNGGMADSDEEESDDEQSDSDEEDEANVVLSHSAVLAKENEVVPPTPTPAPRFNGARTLPEGASLSLSATKEETVPVTPARKAFGGDRKPLAMRMAEGLGGDVEAIPSALPQRVASGIVAEQDDEDSVQEEERSNDRVLDDEEEERGGIDYLNMPMRELAPLSPITEATECTRSSRTPATTIARHAWTPTPPGSGQGSYDHDADDSTYGAQAARASLPPLHDQEPVAGSSEELTILEQAAERSLAIADPVDTHEIQLEDRERPVEATVRVPEVPEASTWHRDALPNPVCPFETEVSAAILGSLAPPLESCAGFVDLSNFDSNQLPGLQRRAGSHAGGQRRSSGHSSQGNAGQPDAPWTMTIGEHSLPVRQKLGEGGYGAVFLVEDVDQLAGAQGDEQDASLAGMDDESAHLAMTPKLIAAKVETPPNRWEFYILTQLRLRLADERSISSIVCARKFFCAKQESFLLMEYADKGTLLEVVNNAVKAGVASSSAMGGGASTGAAGSASVGVDEILAMFFTVEVIKVIEALHAVDLVHGDLKIDNCLLRLDEPDAGWANTYDSAGGMGWSAKGITLIDFGRAIDLRMYNPGQRFLANWAPEAHDMPQIHAARPWRKDVDYFGIASIAYCLLFGKYIELAPPRAQPEAETYAIDRALRRYWQVDIWNALFSLCLNANTIDERQASDRLADVRGQMQRWLEENCFRAGKNLRGSLKRLELWSMKRGL